MTQNGRKQNSGFSLIETVVVIAIITTILSFGLISTFDSLKGTVFRSERYNILSALERARSRSMTNYFGKSHGACLDISVPAKPKYIIFQSPYLSSNSSNEYLDENPAVTITSTGNVFSCTNGGIVFSQLSGKTNVVDITITEESRTSNISTNIVGRIDW